MSMWSGPAKKDWNEEIAGRIQELDSGKVKPIPWSRGRRRISAILHGRSVMGLALFFVLFYTLQNLPLDAQQVAQSSRHAAVPKTPQDATPHAVINVHQGAPLQAQSQEKEAKDDNKYALWGFVLNFALVLVTGVIAIYAVVQANAGQASAKAAIKSYETVRDLERPWILARMEPPDPDMTIPDSEWVKDTSKKKELVYVIRNYGRSPAWVKKHWSGIKVLTNSSDLPDKPEYDPKQWTIDINLSEFYEPGKRRRNILSIPYGLVWELIERNRFLYIYGWIEYRDVWGDQHETHFSFFYHVPQTGDWNPQQFYSEPATWNYES